MTQFTQDNRWQLIGTSVTGASHIRVSKPNQDAIAWSSGGSRLGDQNSNLEAIEGELPIIIAIADGHGSEKHKYSDKGSRFAVDITVELLYEFISAYQDKSFSEIRRALANELPDQIHKRWKKRVERDINERNDELKKASILSTLEQSTSEVLGNYENLVAYGSTLLAVAVTAKYIIYFQLGDGDILTVFDDGEVSRPLGKDEMLIANETYSLCQPNIQNNFKTSLHVLEDESIEKIPALIMLSTDGYANSFTTEEDVHNAALDFWKITNKSGLKSISRELNNWLNEYSTEGSGDDITLAIIKRVSQQDPDFQSSQIKKLSNEVSQLKKNIADNKESFDQSKLLSKHKNILQWTFVFIIFLFITLIGLVVNAYNEINLLKYAKTETKNPLPQQFEDQRNIIQEYQQALSENQNRIDEMHNTLKSTEQHFKDSINTVEQRLNEKLKNFADSQQKNINVSSKVVGAVNASHGQVKKNKNVASTGSEHKVEQPTSEASEITSNNAGKKLNN